ASSSASFRPHPTLLSSSAAFVVAQCLNVLGTFVLDWFSSASHFVHGRASLVDIL
ncbi:phage DNA packaging protein C, partial [Escherichia coli]|uniref:phage DNA packaging protein C n=1 Tax=Escherichia coli TaxID=562 RepID=UPI0019168256